MINELLIKYKDQKPKDFGDGAILQERLYPASAVIRMLEELKHHHDEMTVEMLSKLIELAEPINDGFYTSTAYIHFFKEQAPKF